MSVANKGVGFMNRREFLELSLAAAAAPLVPLNGDVGGLTGRVVRPGQADYDAARLGENVRFAPSPAAVVFCRSAEDVVHAVGWARTNHVPLRVRAGRHSYEGISAADGVLVVDVSQMNSIRLDASGKTTTVGAGARLLEVYEALWPSRVTVPGGSCATVGIAGLTLGGGYGLLARALGLTCDSLLGVEMVLADGRTVRASATQRPDLFWACRGGGGSFGVATEFTFQAHPVDRVSVYHITWDWADLGAVLRAWQAWAPGADTRLTCILKLMSLRAGTLVSTGQFLGPASELSALLKPLRAAGSPLDVSVEAMDYLDAVHTFAGLKSGSPHLAVHASGGLPCFKGSSDYAARPLGPDAVAVIRHFLATAPASGNLVQMENYGGAIAHVPSGATAFPHRAGLLYGLQYQAYWKQTSAGPENIAWVSGFRRAMQPFVTGGAYSNYADLGVADWPTAYYGSNLARLQRVKARYDPANLIHFPQSISPAA